MESLKKRYLKWENYSSSENEENNEEELNSKKEEILRVKEEAMNNIISKFASAKYFRRN